MVGKKKADIPKQSRRQGLEMSEYVGLIFSFLWFHRGILMAVLVLWGLYLTLTMATNKVSENKRRDADAPAFIPTPQPVRTAPMAEGVSQRQASSLPREPMPVVGRTEKKPIVIPTDPKTVRFQKFISTANTDSLLRRFETLMREIPNVSPIEGIGNIKKCQQIIEHLLAKELAPDQQERLAGMEIEVASQFDAINVQHDMQMPGVREQLMVLATRLQQHPATAVSAKAHLAIFAAHAMDLLFRPTREEVDLLINAYETGFDGIVRGENEIFVILTLLQKLIQAHQIDEVIALRRDVTNRLLNDDLVDLENMGEGLRETIVFGDLELPTLLSRLDGVDETAMQDVNLLCQRLERFPDARLPVFQIALSVLDKHLVNKQYQQASECLAVMQQIQPRIPNAEIKDWFGEALAEYPEKIQMAQVAQ